MEEACKNQVPTHKKLTTAPRNFLRGTSIVGFGHTVLPLSWYKNILPCFVHRMTHDIAGSTMADDVESSVNTSPCREHGTSLEETMDFSVKLDLDDQDHGIHEPENDIAHSNCNASATGNSSTRTPLVEDLESEHTSKSTGAIGMCSFACYSIHVCTRGVWNSDEWPHVFYLVAAAISM
jgi:hypothetical protein